MRILVSSALFASTLVSVADGIAANALFSGANTVMPFAEFSVSTRSAFLTAVTRVDSTGLADAAVATGAVDMPVKLPDPEYGTDAQPGPKSADAVDADGMADALDEAMGDEPPTGPTRTMADVPPEPHAAAPNARPAATAIGRNGFHDVSFS